MVRPYSPVEVEPSGSSGSVRHSNVLTFKTRSSEQDVDRDGEADCEVEICGATESPMAIQGGAPVTVSLQHGSCGADRFGNPTSGEVTAILSK